ncbi:MAG: LacI family DNA-binding transcriptional regulator [Spirochaetales bacterium]|nr:LacI family DNA-binding transcriptional regulator [Spirochaetales bacterium]
MAKKNSKTGVNKPGKINRKQLAELAGVSETTVSRVYNNPELVASDKVELVRKTAAEVGYVPDKTASVLRRKGTGNILFLEIKMQKKYDWTQISYYNWFYADIVRTLFKQMESHMYQLRHYQAESIADILALKNMNICDAILVFNVEDKEIVEALKTLEMPFICCHHTEKLNSVSICATDNFYGGMLAARYLQQAGCKKPVYITGFLKETFAHSQRLNGFLSVFAKKNVAVLDGKIGIDGGFEAGKKIIASIKNAEADCIGVVNDLTAIGVIHALIAAGIKIPEQVSIIGYDNLPFTIALPFKLATVDLFLNRIYATAVDLVIKSIRNEKIYREVIKPAIVPGESVRL